MANPELPGSPLAYATQLSWGAKTTKGDPVMGDLIKMPHSELHATMEVLDRLGVNPHDFEVLRKASSWSQATVARVHKTDPSVWAALELEDVLVRLGFAPGEIRALAGREDLLRLVKQALCGQSGKASPEEPLWKRVSETAINVNLGFSPKLPFDGAEIEKHVGSGWVPVEKRIDGLYVDGRKVILHLSRRQQNGKWLKGHDLRDELTGKPVLNANILDALYENAHLIPEDWKRDETGNILYIFFWGTVFRCASGLPYVRFLYFLDGRWDRLYFWLVDDWVSGNPAAVLAS